MRRLPILRLISAGPSTTFTRDRSFSGTRGPSGELICKFANVFHAVAEVFRQPDYAGEPTLSFVDFGCSLACDGGFDHVVDVRRIETVASDGAAVDVDGEVLLTTDAVHAGVLRALDAGGYSVRSRLAFCNQRIQIVSVEHDGDIGADPGDHLIDPIADGLRHHQVDPGQSCQPLADLLGNAVLGHATRPLVIRSQRGQHIRLIGTGGIGRRFAAA